MRYRAVEAAHGHTFCSAAQAFLCACWSYAVTVYPSWSAFELASFGQSFATHQVINGQLFAAALLGTWLALSRIVVRLALLDETAKMLC